MPMRTVFLSSTSKDLIGHREQCYHAIESLEGYHCIRMENFGARAWEAKDFCDAQVRKSDLVIFLLGPCYGSSPTPDTLSFTEREYEAAVCAGIPYIVLATSGRFPLPVELIEPDAQRRKQEVFRERVKSRVQAFFVTPEEASRQSVTAIRNWEQEIATRESGVRDRAIEQPQPNLAGALLGPLTSKACNRARQYGRLTRTLFINHLPIRGLPHQRPPATIYVLPGPESEAHGSLIERFQFSVLQEVADRIRGEDKAVVNGREIVPWPADGELEDRKWDLLHALFARCDALDSFRGVETPASELRKVGALKGAEFYVLRHSIRAADFSGRGLKLLHFYRKFWDGLDGGGEGPFFVVFLSVTFPDRTIPLLGQAWRSFRFSLALRRLTMGPVSNKCSVIPLDPLGPVTQGDVREWMKEHSLYKFDHERRKAVQELFRRDDGRIPESLPMADIEPSLEEIRLKFLHRRRSLDTINEARLERV